QAGLCGARRRLTTRGTRPPPAGSLIARTTPRRNPMAHARHEIPTHLNIEDTFVAGLSLRQVLCLVLGLAGGYGLWTGWPALPLPARAAAAALCVLLAAAVALVRPAGRGLEEWAFVLLHYAALPRLAVWAPADPHPADWLAGGMPW